MRALVLALAIVPLAASDGIAEPLPAWTEPVTGMRFVLVPAGSFTMGSPAAETGREAQETPHRVTLTRPFWLGRTEVTQGEWQRVMGSNPSKFSDGGAQAPVEQVSFHDVQRFLVRLGELAPGSRFRLPTEAEWEYACRAGTTTAYSTGANAHDGAGELRRALSPAGTAERGQPRPHACRSVPSRRTPGASSTCTATSGSGRPTSTAPILRAR